jgi:hypothetical protein
VRGAIVWISGSAAVRALEPVGRPLLGGFELFQWLIVGAIPYIRDGRHAPAPRHGPFSELCRPRSSAHCCHVWSGVLPC